MERLIGSFSLAIEPTTAVAPPAKTRIEPDLLCTLPHSFVVVFGSNPLRWHRSVRMFMSYKEYRCLSVQPFQPSWLNTDFVIDAKTSLFLLNL